MNEELKECPFCGGKADLDEIPGNPDTIEPYAFGVGCKKCNIGWYEKTEKEAINRWNLRATPANPQTWIPVSERLPKRFERVVVYLPKWRNQICIGYWSGDFWSVGPEIAENQEITHWMPLPEPPKEDAECGRA